MKIQVLQGLNLKNDITTIIAELEDATPYILDYFKDMHPVFLEDYQITQKEGGKILEIQTHLPHLWKNEKILKNIEDLAMGKISQKEAEDKTLSIAKKMIYSMSSIPTLHAAHRRGYETLQLLVDEGIHEKPRFNKTHTIGIGVEQHLIKSAKTTKDSSMAKSYQRDKKLTNHIIEKIGLPIARWQYVKGKNDLKKTGEHLGYPLVMKPVGLTAGHGVLVGLENLEQLEDAWDRIHEYYEKDMKNPNAKSDWQKKIIVQQMLKGDDYRFLVINGKLEIATHRIRARVTGDGSSTISELIKEENCNPQRDMRRPTHTLKPIKIDAELKSVLKKQGLNLASVPEKDEIIRVRDVASMSQGGITADVTDKVHPQIRLLCESLAQSIHAYILGVDILCQDVSKPLTIDNGGIIEMNTMPETYLNSHPVIGRQYPEIGDIVLDGLMDADIRTNKVVVIGEMDWEEVKKNIEEKLNHTDRCGRVYKNNIYIDEHRINQDIPMQKAILSVKRNKSLETIIIQYTSPEAIEEYGFGFNSIDLLIFKKGTLEDSFEKRIEKLQKDNLIKAIVRN